MEVLPQLNYLRLAKGRKPIPDRGLLALHSLAE